MKIHISAYFIYHQRTELDSVTNVDVNMKNNDLVK